MNILEKTIAVLMLTYLVISCVGIVFALIISYFIDRQDKIK